MTKTISEEPTGATPLDDISGLLRNDVSTRGQLDSAESLNILGATEWINSGRIGDVFTVAFYKNLHRRMYDQVWSWAGVLRSDTGATPNIGVAPEKVPQELGRVAMESASAWEQQGASDLVAFVARYHHALVRVHPFNNGNGRWARLASDVVVERIAKRPSIVWATDTLSKNSDERSAYIAALVQADGGNIQGLVKYLATLNPD